MVRVSYYMRTRISSKGQVVLPSLIRHKLCIKAGDLLEAKIEGDHITLTPHRKPKRKPRITISKLTGMPSICLGPHAPEISSKWVRHILAEFP